MRSSAELGIKKHQVSVDRQQVKKLRKLQYAPKSTRTFKDSKNSKNITMTLKRTYTMVENDKNYGILTPPSLSFVFPQEKHRMDMWKRFENVGTHLSLEPKHHLL